MDLKRILFLNRKIDVEKLDKEDWDKQYLTGRWSYLNQLPDLSHYSIIEGYCQYVSAKGRILDVGCGEGVLQQRLSVLPYDRYTGIDVSSVAIDIANKNYSNDRTEFFVADARTYESSMVYDLIIFNESLYCFNDAVSILNHYKNMLSSGGMFVISMHEQEVSKHHWGDIEREFDVIDAVHVSNDRDKDLSWRCALVKFK